MAATAIDLDNFAIAADFGYARRADQMQADWLIGLQKIAQTALIEYYQCSS